jgi:hypothetical protein
MLSNKHMAGGQDNLSHQGLYIITGHSHGVGVQLTFLDLQIK